MTFSESIMISNPNISFCNYQLRNNDSGNMKIFNILKLLRRVLVLAIRVHQLLRHTSPADHDHGVRTPAAVPSNPKALEVGCGRPSVTRRWVDSDPDPWSRFPGSARRLPCHRRVNSVSRLVR